MIMSTARETLMLLSLATAIAIIGFAVSAQAYDTGAVANSERPDWVKEAFRPKGK